MALLIRAKVSTSQAEEIGQNVNIGGSDPYFTIITGVDAAVNLNTASGDTMKKIRNEAGQSATINCVDDTQWGGNDRIVLANNSWVMLCFAPADEEGSDRWYVLDRKDTGVTLS